MLEIGVRNAQMKVGLLEKDWLLNDDWFSSGLIDLWLCFFLFFNRFFFISQEVFTGFTLFFLSCAFTFSFCFFLTFR